MAHQTTGTSELDYILLCLIRMHPDISGYDLRSIINKSTGFFFHAHLSQIYPALKRLSERGLVEHTLVKRESQPNLKLYRITEDGIDAANSWLTQPFVFEYTTENAQHYFLKLILMGHAESEALLAYIDQGIAAFSHQRDLLAEYDLQTEREFVEGADPIARSRYLTVWEHEYDFMLRELNERVKWLERLRGDIA